MNQELDPVIKWIKHLFHPEIGGTNLRCAGHFGSEWCFAVPRLITTPGQFGPYIVLRHFKFQSHGCRFRDAQVLSRMSLLYTSLGHLMVVLYSKYALLYDMFDEWV